MSFRLMIAASALAFAVACAGEKKDADADNAAASSSSAAQGPDPFAGDSETVARLQNAATFAAIADETTRAQAVFGEMFKVISSPRCMNCHPRGDSPTQGDEMRPHHPPVSRGPKDRGVAGMECGTCHGEANVAYVVADGSIPGHSPWAVAPISMGWVGASAAEVCEQIKDRARNGDRSLEALLEHHAEDGLVGWAWDPGPGRAPAPGDQETFGALTAAWIAAGAHCPSAS